MKRRQFLKAALYGTGGGMLALGSFGTLAKVDPQRVVASGSEEEITVYSACEMCRNQCPIAVKVVNGRVARIEGNPHDSSFGGVLCARGNAGVSLLYDPQRLKKPMIRTGNRGEGKFKEVSWDEAYSYIAERLQAIRAQYGGEAIAFASRRGPHDIFFRSIAKIVGSPNTFSHDATCPISRDAALKATFGTSSFGIDYGNAKYIISVGRNYFEGIHISQTRGVLKALNNGAKLVVLDPRFSVSAAKGEWIPVKPATEIAFIMALANVLIAEDLYDKDFIERYTVGFEEWAETVKDKTPAWAEKETEIPQDKIVQIAREFAAAKPKAIIDYGWRTAWTTDDFELRRAIMIVNMMVGNFEVPGGYYIKKTAKVLQNYPELSGMAKGLGGLKQPEGPAPQKPRIDGAGTKGALQQIIPSDMGAVGQVIESILTEKPYPIKAWMIHRFNPYISMTDSERVKEAFMKLDLLVTCDVYMTDTAYYSDVILPENTYLERYEQIYDMSGAKPKYALRQPAVPNVYPDTKPHWQIYKELGEKLGGADFFPFTDIEDFLNQQLAAAGLTLSQMKEKGFWSPENMKAFYVRENDPHASLEDVLGTKSKKIEIISEEVKQAGKSGLPTYTKHPQPSLGEFRFVQGKVAVHTNAGTANVPVLNELMPSNSLWMNVRSGEQLGLKDGDEIIITAGNYSQKGKVKLTEGIREDTVFAYHGFGRISPQMQRAFGKGINGNGLMPNVIGEAGNNVQSMTFVKVTKA